MVKKKKNNSTPTVTSQVLMARKTEHRVTLKRGTLHVKVNIVIGGLCSFIMC